MMRAARSSIFLEGFKQIDSTSTASGGRRCLPLNPHACFIPVLLHFELKKGVSLTVAKPSIPRHHEYPPNFVDTDKVADHTPVQSSCVRTRLEVHEQFDLFVVCYSSF